MANLKCSTKSPSRLNFLRNKSWTWNRPWEMLSKEIWASDSLCFWKHLSHAMRKCVFGSLWPGKTQTDLLSCRDQLESCKFGYINYRYHSDLAANNKGTDQTARMRRLICAFVVCIWHKTHFLMAWLIYKYQISLLLHVFDKSRIDINFSWKQLIITT